MQTASGVPSSRDGIWRAFRFVHMGLLPSAHVGKIPVVPPFAHFSLVLDLSYCPSVV